MAGSSDNVGLRDEHGKLIDFPRSSWVSADGVEPLGPGPMKSGESATATGEDPERELEAFEPDDFWASGQTQQFVGGGDASTGAGLNSASEALRSAQPGLADAPPAPDRDLPSSDRAVHRRARWSQLSLPGPATLLVAALAVCALAGTGVTLVLLNGSAQRQPPREPVASHHQTGSTPAHRPRVARRSPHHAVSHHRARARHHPTVRRRSRRSVVSASTSSTTSPAVYSPAEVSSTTETSPAQPVYQPPASAASSTSHHRTASGAHRSGPTGTVSLIGAGTTPSG